VSDHERKTGIAPRSRWRHRPTFVRAGAAVVLTISLIGVITAFTLQTGATSARATDPTGGYWQVTANGSVYAFGGAKYFGGANNLHLNAPIIRIVPTSDGGGYWLVAADGGVFSYGDATFEGTPASVGATLSGPVVDANGLPGGTATSGSQGPQGPPGPQGIQGIQGIQGTAGTLASAYLDAYSTTSPTIASGGAFTFDTVNAVSGITANGTANTTFTVSSTGTYLVSFSLQAVLAPITPQLEVNGAAVGPAVTVLSHILHLSAGDSISFVNTFIMSGMEPAGTGFTIVRIA
jgi:hypothetical protein